MDKKQKRKKIFKDIKSKYDSADLDDEVHALMSQKASNINNAGIDAQLEFLADEAGLEWLKEYFQC